MFGLAVLKEANDPSVRLRPTLFDPAVLEGVVHELEDSDDEEVKAACHAFLPPLKLHGSFVRSFIRFFVRSFVRPPVHLVLTQSLNHPIAQSHPHTSVVVGCKS